ncbi:MAG: hypothetical protein JXQ73_17045 [Phycisphaerae bacterium]|nr:hypothetical protein [Phycisphaerae bacterium]
MTAEIRNTRWILAAVCLIATSVGCGPKTTSQYEVRQIEMGQLASNAPKPDANAYAILQKTKSVGRFPCSLSVMRVKSGLPDDWTGEEPPADLSLQIDLLTEPKAVPWSELFDNVPAVTNVKVLNRPSVPFEQVTLTELVSAGRKQHTDLILIYGQNDLGAKRVKLLGAIYDTETNELLATIDAQVDPVSGLPTPPDRVKGDKRHEDPEWLTTRKFQDLVLHCVFDLAQRDTPSTTTRPNPWDRPGVQPMISPWTERLYDR